MSPELDLLERLTGEDTSLHEAAFGSCYPFRDLAHAKQVVAVYLQLGLVELYDRRPEPDAVIAYHTSRWLLEEPSNWERETRYFLRITQKGYQQLAEDSQGFFDRLFS